MEFNGDYVLRPKIQEDRFFVPILSNIKLFSLIIIVSKKLMELSPTSIVNCNLEWKKLNFSRIPPTLDEHT